METIAKESGAVNKLLDVETQKRRLEDFALKRKFASLSSKIDRVHRQVKMRLHQKKFTWVPSPCLSKDESQHLIAQHEARIRDFVQRTCNKLLQDTLLPRFQEVFGSPVDVNRFPQYPSIVKNPMDFGTMKTKLQEEKYRDLQEFVDDAMLVLDNARAFNPPGSDVHVMANCLEDDLVKALKETVIKNREAVDCATLKDIEQKRCETMARAVFQLQKCIESDIEVAKGVLMEVQRDAADTSRWASDVCSWRSDMEPDVEFLFNQVLQLPEVLQKLLGQLRPKGSQKSGLLRVADFENASFVFHHTARSIISQYDRDIRDRYSEEIPFRSSVAQPSSPRMQAATHARVPTVQDFANALPPTPVVRTASAALGATPPQSADAADGILAGNLQRSMSVAHVSGGGRRLARINTRGVNSLSAMSTPVTLHDCGSSAFDRQTPREMIRSRSQQHDAWVFCRSLAREACLAWPGLPDGSGCREPHIAIEGMRLKSSRAYTCARAISDRMCTTYTAANSNTAWLPLVHSANPRLLDSVLANAPCPVIGAGPSVLLAGYQKGKLQVQRRIQDSTQEHPSPNAVQSATATASVPPKAAEKCTKAGKKVLAPEGKETRARAQEKLRVSIEVQPAAPIHAMQSSPRKQRPENLSQVAIRVFSLPNAESDATHIARRASHLGRSTGVAEIPHQTTQDLLFAPSRRKALPLMAELLNPVPLAPSWSQQSSHHIRQEVSVLDAGSQEMPEQELEMDSPDEAAMDTILPARAGPSSRIPMMTPVAATSSDGR